MKMIKIVHRNLPGVSNIAEQERIILQNYCACNLSIAMIINPIFMSEFCYFDKGIY